MKYGLVGEKLSQSFSPYIHSQLFGYDYELCPLLPLELRQFLLSREFSGVNVTAPYKETVLPYLDAVDDIAASIGAVNTIVNRSGRLYGYNTDYDGLRALIEHANMSLNGKKVLILGSGGTSKTAMVVAKSCGCLKAVRVSRTAKEDCITYAQARSCCADAQILINTTPCGMYPHIEECPVNIRDFPSLEGVIDVVYNPLRTELVCDAIRCGIPAVGGLYMLVAQAAYAGALFSGRTVSQAEMDETYRKLLADKENIVLIGMPGCGKTTVGKRLAEWTGRPFIDTDDAVESRCGCSIAQLFSQAGESAFRNYESTVVNEIAHTQGTVIATGGGVVLRPENIRALMKNGRVYWIDRDISLLIPTVDRPLSATYEDLSKRYEERFSLYDSACDVRVQSDGAVDEIANQIREDFLHENFGD